MSLARNDVNSSVDSSPLPLVSTVRISDRAISWIEAPGWIGFMQLRSWLRDQSRARRHQEQAGCPRPVRREIRGFRVQAPHGVSPVRQLSAELPTPNLQETPNSQFPTPNLNWARGQQ